MIGARFWSVSILISASDPLEIPADFPVGDAPIGFGLLPAGKVYAMLDHAIAKSGTQNRGMFERRGCFRQRRGDVRSISGCIGVAGARRSQRQFVFYTVKHSRDKGGISEIRIDVGAGNTALDPKAVALSEDSESGGAVVQTPDRLGWRERAGLKSFVGIHERSQQQHHVPRERDLPGQVVFEHFGETMRTGRISKSGLAVRQGGGAICEMARS